MTKRRLAIVLLALVFSSFVAAETKSAVDAFVQDFPDNVDLRKQYRNSVITATKELAWAFSERVLPSAGAGQVKIKVQKRAADFLVQFVNARDGRFDEYSKGSFVIQRDLSSGFIVQVKIFIEDDPSCYVRLYPQAEASRLDVVMYGTVLKKGLYVPGMIYELLTAPFSSLVEATRRSFNWQQVCGSGLDDASSAFAALLRSPAPASISEGPDSPPPLPSPPARRASRLGRQPGELPIGPPVEGRLRGGTPRGLYRHPRRRESRHLPPIR